MGLRSCRVILFSRRVMYVSTAGKAMTNRAHHAATVDVPSSFVGEVTTTTTKTMNAMKKKRAYSPMANRTVVTGWGLAVLAGWKERTSLPQFAQKFPRTFLPHFGHFIVDTPFYFTLSDRLQFYLLIPPADQIHRDIVDVRQMGHGIFGVLHQLIV